MQQSRQTPAFAVAAFAAVAPAAADPMLADFDYPYAVLRFAFRSQDQSLAMAYMDVTAGNANGKTVVLLNGKNFCGATWEGVAGPLSAAGYRVVIPDQIGFCKSSKPRAYQFDLHQLAANTHALLASIGVEDPISSAIPWAACWRCATRSCIRAIHGV
jgi:pimeloyl-ACP methyl ester carboxylesterase